MIVPVAIVLLRHPLQGLITSQAQLDLQGLISSAILRRWTLSRITHKDKSVEPNCLML